MTNESKCALCGEPMPPGEEMFKFHGYSGPCPKPPTPKPRDVKRENFTAALAQLVKKHMPWPYSDVRRDSDEATDAASAIAKKHVDALWADMGER